jgi:hypothetical protein
MPRPMTSPPPEVQKCSLRWGNGPSQRRRCSDLPQGRVAQLRIRRIDQPQFEITAVTSWAPTMSSPFTSMIGLTEPQALNTSVMSSASTMPSRL